MSPFALCSRSTLINISELIIANCRNERRVQIVFKIDNPAKL